MHMQNVLLQPAPQLLNRIKPRSIGRKLEQTDGQVIMDSLWARAGGPRTGHREWPTEMLRLKASQQVWVEVKGGIILSHQYHLRTRIGCADFLIKVAQFSNTYLVALLIMNLTRHGIQSSHDPALPVIIVR